jgi:hypothetical protein
VGANRGAELTGHGDVVRRDRHDAGVGDGELGLQRRELEVLLLVLRAVVPASEHQDERVVALKLAQPASLPRVVRQLVVGGAAPGDHVGAHGVVLSVPGGTGVTIPASRWPGRPEG